MKSALISFGIIFVLLLTMNSCGLGQAKEDAEKTIDVFHQHMKVHNHEAMLKMIDKKALKVTSKEEWLEIFEAMDRLGKIKKITQDSGFNTSINNGVTTVELSYTIVFDEGTKSENFIMRKRGKEFKILGYFVQ